MASGCCSPARSVPRRSSCASSSRLPRTPRIGSSNRAFVPATSPRYLRGARNSTTGGAARRSFSSAYNPRMARMVKCIKLGREAQGLDFPPYPGDLGKRIWESVSKEAWAQWLKQQTMLVNENRLNLADAKARKYLMEQTERHFFGQGADSASGYVPPQK